MPVQPFSATAPVKALAGSNTKPSITFTGNTGSGLYSPGANKVAIATGGTQRLLIDENGSITVANKISVPLGTQELPSIFFGSDTNNGIYSPGADQVAISTNGTGRLFVDSAGNVGVNTTSAASYSMNLAVVGTIGLIPSAFNVVGSSVSVKSQLGIFGGEEIVRNEITSFANGANYQTATIFSTRNGPGAGERLRITSDGKVGLGTSSPGNSLEVVGDYLSNGAEGHGTLNITSNNTGNNGQDARPSIGFSAPYSVDGVRILYGLIEGRKEVSSQGLVSGFLAFSTSPTDIPSTGPVERMRIDSLGRVGVGTTSPASPLEVVGTSSEVVRFRGNGANGGWAAWNSGGTNYGYIGPAALLASGTSTQFTIRSENELIFTSNGGTERARIDSSGRLGIGTTSPVGPLDIAAGGAGPSRVIVSQTSDNPYIDIYRSTGIGSNLAGFRLSQPSVDGELVFSNAASATIGSHSFTERARIDSNGYLRLAGGGIQFNGDTAAANALDDYEEGTYSMSVTGTAGGSIVFTSPTLTYLKVGRLVFISGSIVVSSSTAAGSELIASLPFSASSTSSFGEKDCTFNDNSAGTRTVIYLRADSTSLFKLNLNAATPAVNDIFRFSFSYYAA